jgi:hypothetical protein
MIDIEVTFFAEEIPEWMCPTCNKSLLDLNKQVHHVKQITAIGHEAIEHESFEPDWITERGVFSLQCQNPRCKEVVSVTALGSVEQHHDPRVPYEYQKGPQYGTRFKPTYFDPPLLFFPIMESVPELVRTAILESFALVWSHPDSAGNAIRRSIENLLTHFRVPRRFRSKKNKMEVYSLHARIEKFGAKKKFKECADRLLALKWIGNAGSHAGKSLSKQDVLDGFEILASTLALLFEEGDQGVKKKVRQINKRKGPMG